MRMSRLWLAVICLVAPIFTGCTSTGNSFAMKSPSWWPWGKKDLAETSVAGANPQLPSQSVNPDSALAATGYGVPHTPNSGYPGYTPPQTTGAYTGAPQGYPTTPPGGSYANNSLYEASPAGYANQYPTAGTPAMPASYPQTDPTTGNVALQNQYQNADYARAADPSMGGYGAAANPMSAGYNEYTTPAAQPQMAAAPQTPAAGMSPNPYAIPEQPNPYGAPSYQTADARGSAAYGAATAPAYPQQPAMPATQAPAYPAATDPMAGAAQPWNPSAAAPPAAQSGYTADPMGYQPSQTGFAPGATGYQPAGVPAYQPPAGTYQPPAGEYRPGGTGTYPRAGASTTAPANNLTDAGLNVVAPASLDRKSVV